jgi:hypothetical protein
MILLLHPMDYENIPSHMKITSHIPDRIHVVQIFDPYVNALSIGRLIIVLIISN